MLRSVFLLLVSFFFLAPSASAQQWADDGSGNLYYNGGNVGIGVTNPWKALTVNGTATFDLPNNVGRINLGTPLAEPGIVFFQPGETDRFNMLNRGGYMQLGYHEDNGSGNLLFLEKGGNVGIGVSDPAHELDVAGNLRLQDEKPYLHLQSSTTSTYGKAGLTLSNTTIPNNETFKMEVQRVELGDGSLSSDLILSRKTNDSYLFFLQVTGRNRNVILNGHRGGSSPASYGNVLVANGKLGVGTPNPRELLDVAGKVRSKEVIVTNQNWPDYVFSPTYDLRTLSDVRAFIDTHGHLPDVPSAAEVAENGQAVGTTQATLLKKIEELTLYAIDQQDALEAEQARNDALETRVNRQQEQIDALRRQMQRLVEASDE